MTLSLRIAGLLLLALASSSLFVPRILAYRENMERVAPTVREIFYIHNLYVTLFVLAFAVLCLVYPADLLGTGAGRFVCAFLAAAWLLRLALQAFYHNREIKRAWPLMNVAYSLTFLYLGIVFAVAAAGLGR